MAVDAIMLPPINLTSGELEALNLGMAIVAEAADPDLQATAQSLVDKALLDKVYAVLPQETIAGADAWKFAVYPFQNAARGLSYVPVLRGDRSAAKTEIGLSTDRRDVDRSGDPPALTGILGARLDADVMVRITERFPCVPDRSY